MIFSRLSLVTFLGPAAAFLASDVEPALESRTLHPGFGGGLDIGAGVGIGGGVGVGGGAGAQVSRGHGSSSSKGKGGRDCGCDSQVRLEEEQGPQVDFNEEEDALLWQATGRAGRSAKTFVDAGTGDDGPYMDKREELVGSR
ncbi:hypothetical protein JCM10296v2_004196 [Rhodotorula toruloides]